MMNARFAQLTFACLLIVTILGWTDAQAQKRTKPKSKRPSVTETSKPRPSGGIDVMGLQSIGGPQPVSTFSDTVVSSDGKMKVVNTPTGAYFILNQPNAAQRDTLNDWYRSAHGERASDVKRR